MSCRHSNPVADGTRFVLVCTECGATKEEGAPWVVPRTPRTCAWCRRLLEATSRGSKAYCSQSCRQFAFRIRRRRATETRNEQPMRFAFADPPYPGLAQRYYGKEPDFAGEVDHKALIASLTARANGFDGWALSTSSEALRDVLPLCPPETRVCPWVKPIGAAPLTFGAHNTWEPLIVVEGRKLRPGFRDWLLAQPARGGGTLMGRKPLAFCAFLFQQLGMLPGDELVELFPGTGIVSRAWAEYGKRPLSEAPLEPDDATYQRRREHGMRLKGELEPSLRERAVGRVRG